MPYDHVLGALTRASDSELVRDGCVACQRAQLSVLRI
jgi:hypothetical protein